MLITNRKKPIAICARAILRSGTGHKYWSTFTPENQARIVSLSAEFYQMIFEPEVDTPLKTLDIPLGGSVSPVGALALLIDFLTIAGTRDQKPKSIQDYPDDPTGAGTIDVLVKAMEIANRITGNSPGSLGLHPAVYFYNENGRYSRFLFLGMVSLITDKIRSNDGGFFKLFARGRQRLEGFLMENKSLLGILLQNMSKSQRVPRIRDLLGFLVAESATGKDISPDAAINQLGLTGRFFDVNSMPTAPHFSDDTKSKVFLNAAIASAMKCAECGGYLDPRKSISYDHIKRVKDGGTGEHGNAQLLHPYCNTGMKG